MTALPGLGRCHVSRWTDNQYKRLVPLPLSRLQGYFLSLNFYFLFNRLTTDSAQNFPFICAMDSLKEQVSNLTLYDLKAGVRKVQNGKPSLITDLASFFGISLAN